MHAGLATESFELRSHLCRANPDIVEAMVAAGRPRPETSAFAVMLFEQEDVAMRKFVDLLAEKGWLLVAPIFDAVLAVPGPETVPGAEQALKDQWQQETGLLLHLKQVC